jgi:hypothetical protein
VTAVEKLTTSCSQSGRFSRDLLMVKTVRTAFIPNFGICVLRPASADYGGLDRKAA